MSDEPKWRTDFPIRWEGDNYTTRREFTKFLVLASGATFLGNGYFVVKRLDQQREEHPTVDVASVGEVPVGGVKLFRYPTEDIPAVLIRLGEDEYVAFLQRCTHLSCPVHYIRERERIECPCHNGVFDARTGRVVEGPPPRPLPRIRLRVADGRIQAEGIMPA
ncbi:MAG: Rieske (2Fe-2S) protein [Chthonomonadales bacterium]|nr:Rieske (2Fe-2S) protein [Chthonomonadales bacterium]